MVNKTCIIICSFILITVAGLGNVIKVAVDDLERLKLDVEGIPRISQKQALKAIAHLNYEEALGLALEHGNRVLAKMLNQNSAAEVSGIAKATRYWVDKEKMGWIFEFTVSESAFLAGDSIDFAERIEVIVFDSKVCLPYLSEVSAKNEPNRPLNCDAGNGSNVGTLNGSDVEFKHP